MTDGAVLPRRPLGATGLEVTSLCVGTSPLASMPGLYGYSVEAARAVATVRAVFDSPINYIDTSNNYGEGTAELRIGEALREIGGLPAGAVLATKVDADYTTGDFSGSRVRRSLDESLERLGVDHLQLLHLHDPERMSFEEATEPGGAVDTLVELKREGIVDNIGVAGGPIELLLRFVELGVFDAVLSHNRLTLIDQSAAPLFEEARRRGMGVMNAAPYGGGMLAKGPAAQPKYGYGERGSELTDRVLAMERACEAHEVPLAAAALQFSLRDDRVDSTVVGISSPERVEQTLSYATWAIPDELWPELEALSPGSAGLD